MMDNQAVRDSVCVMDNDFVFVFFINGCTCWSKEGTKCKTCGLIL